MINLKLISNPLNWMIVGSSVFLGIVTYGLVRGTSPVREHAE